MTKRQIFVIDWLDWQRKAKVLKKWKKSKENGNKIHDGIKSQG